MSKGYTINFFTRVVANASSKDLRDHVTYAIAPRSGAWSVKYATFNTLLGGKAFSIATGLEGFQKAGNTPRRRLLNALKARKNGTFNAFVKKYTVVKATW